MATKALRIFIIIIIIIIIICPLLKSERLSAGTKLTLYKALIRSILTHACPAWEFAADSHILKSQRLQNRVLGTVGNLPRRIPTRDLHMAFKSPYLYDFITKLCRQQKIVTLNHDNVNIRITGQGKARHQKYKRLNLMAVRHMIDQLSRPVVFNLFPPRTPRDTFPLNFVP
jgi:hypothetical protein